MVVAAVGAAYYYSAKGEEEQKIDMPPQRWILDKYGGPEGLRLVDFEMPEPTSRQILIKVLASTATYTDQLIMRGTYMPSPPLPLTPGYDAVGEILSMGNEVPEPEFAVGDRVVVMPQAHCMATHLVLEYTAVVKVPSNQLPTEQVVCIRTGVTAWQMLHRCCSSRMKDPKNVTLLIHGAAGATGSVLLSIALTSGVLAKNIFATAKTSNLNILNAFRVKAAIDYTTEDWSARVLQETNGEGVDLVFDAVCLQGYYEKGLACLKAGGKYVSYGFTQEPASAGLLPIPSVLAFFIKQWWQQNVNSWVSGREAEFYIIASRRDTHPDEFKEDLLKVLDLVGKSALVLPGGRTWRFPQCKEALLSVAENTHVGVQIVRFD